MTDVSLLLRRTGFGTTGAEVEAATRRGYEATVEALLHPGPDPGAAATPPPDLSGEPAPPPKDDKDARRTYARQLRTRSATLTLWWLDRMVAVEQPATERLTWFWHGHFATSAKKVKAAGLMLTQNQTFRAHALGSFSSLAHAMITDPRGRPGADRLEGRSRPQPPTRRRWTG